MSLRFFSRLILLLTLACGDPVDSHPPENEPSNKLDNSPEQQQGNVAKDGKLRELKQYPRLSNENCEAFLLKYAEEHPQERVLISTSMGDIEVELFEKTPIHRANFLYLIERNYYNPTEILRVVQNFIIQGGNSQEPEPAEKRFLIGEYTLPSEFHADYIHTRGALAMSRLYEGNPDKRSSAYDFYIVHGKKIGSSELFEARRKRPYTEAQIEAYKTTGGAIHLDQEHTVFGRVVKGLDVVDKIASVEVDQGNWPKTYIEVRMKVLD